MFLVNVMPTFVLFDSRATRSFVSLAFNKNFDVILGALDHSLVVKIVDDCTVSASKVYRDCVMQMFRVKYLIDLVHIHLRETKVIMGMDWLS